MGSLYLPGTVPLSLFSHRTWKGGFQTSGTQYIGGVLPSSFQVFPCTVLAYWIFFFFNKTVASPVAYFLFPESRVAGRSCWKSLACGLHLALTWAVCVRPVMRGALAGWKSPESHVGYKSALRTLQAQRALQEDAGFAGILKWSPSQQVYFAVYWGDGSQETWGILFTLLLTSCVTLGKSPHLSRSSFSHW